MNTTQTHAAQVPTEKVAPVQGYAPGIPWSMHLEAYAAYCKKWSPQPSLIDLEGRNCRGGFSTGELDEFIPGWRDKLSELGKLREEVKRLQALLAKLQPAQDDEALGYLAEIRDGFAKMFPGVEDGLLMNAIGGPCEVPAYVLAVARSLHPAQEPAQAARKDFETEAANKLHAAWINGWEACRDSEFVGVESMHDAFNRSSTLNDCLDLDQVEPAQAGELPDEREQFKCDMKTIGERHGWSFGEGLEWDEARQDWGVSDMYTNWMWWAWLEARAALAARKPLTDEQVTMLYAEHAGSADCGCEWVDAMGLARAIERAHGINGLEVKT